MESKFEGNFTQQDAIPEIAIERANEVLRSGRLHRYNLAENEIGEVGLLETEFAKFVGSNYCLAVASGGYTLSTALRALGIGYGDKVLTNAFTLAPVPGAIASVGAIPVFVDVTEKLVIDLKTTSDIDKFQWSANKFNYDSQAFIYSTLFGYEMLFIVIDKETHQIGLFDCSPDFYSRGEDKVRRACDAYELFYQTEDFDHKQHLLTKTL